MIASQNHVRMHFFLVKPASLQEEWSFDIKIKITAKGSIANPTDESQQQYPKSLWLILLERRLHWKQWKPGQYKGKEKSALCVQITLNAAISILQ